MSNGMVDWLEFNEETLNKAKEEKKAIFIYNFYKGCRLCDEMEQKVLSHPEVVALLQKYFIAIKIERDERPDLDRYYQNAHQLINSRLGGWPLSTFATPLNKPFFSGTYIEVESQAGSIEGMGFVEIAQLIGQKIQNDDADVIKNAEDVYTFLSQKKYPTQATKLSESFVKNFMLQVKQNYDVKYGGFSKAPKFPQTATLLALLRVDTLYDDKAAKAMFLTTLQNMSNGGYFDKENGGFYRYSLDDDYSSHSEDKTLYDNALLCEVYTKGYLQYKEQSFLEVAKKSADFWIKNMAQDDLLYSYLYSDMIDKRVQTLYNAMMIKSLFLLGTIESKYKDYGLKILDALLDNLLIDGKLYHLKEDKRIGVEAFFDDYAFLSGALLIAYKTTQNEHYLIYAQKCINDALEYFYEYGGWNFNEGDLRVDAEVSDRIYKSAISEIVENLIVLGELLDDEKYIHFAFKTLEYYSYELGRKPSITPSLFEAMLVYLKREK